MSSPSQVKVVAFWIALPYLLGFLLYKFVLPEDYVTNLVAPVVSSLTSRQLKETSVDAAVGTLSSSAISSNCESRFRKLLELTGDDLDPFQGISIVMHRNGEATACGNVMSRSGFKEELKKEYIASVNGEDCTAVLDKYQVESLVTSTLNNIVFTCLSTEKDGNKKAGFLGFCDMGPKKTPILLDHDELVPVVSPTNNKKSLPCRFHTREGLRISQLNQLTHMTQAQPGCEPNGNEKDQTCSAEPVTPTELHLYAVPAGRVFMFAPSFVGEIFHLPHVEGSEEKMIYLEVISLVPRVFDVFNFFSRDESQELVDRANDETRDSHRIKRSSTGASGYNLNSRRTSESGFDTHGKMAVKVKKRCFKALGFDEYIESHGDGLQILRYNVTTAYNSHMDWIEDKSGQLEHDYESGGTGGNRFATILMYMSDLGPDDGGETVFPKGWPPGVAEDDRVEKKLAVEQLRESKRGEVLKKGSWEEDLVATCRSRLAIRPHSSRAVLFYSQLPNGEQDPASLHGACPVLSTQKYAANLWVWNTPRQGYAGSPIKEKFQKKEGDKEKVSSPSGPQMILGKFRNTGQDPNMATAQLYYQDQLWGKLGEGDPELGVNTYEGHTWNLKVDDKVVKTWVISESNGVEQDFSI